MWCVCQGKWASIREVTRLERSCIPTRTDPVCLVWLTHLGWRGQRAPLDELTKEHVHVPGPKGLPIQPLLPPADLPPKLEILHPTTTESPGRCHVRLYIFWKLRNTLMGN